jgi:hypothetical protein
VGRVSLTTIERWLHLPTPGGSDDHLRADHAGSSGLFQILSSNATHLARENGLRVLWEDRGGEFWEDLDAGGASNDPTYLRWEDLDADGVYARLAGTYRVRLWGETAGLPRIELRCRAAAPSTYTTGVALVVTTPGTSPISRTVGGWAVATTTSTSITDLAVSLTAYPLSHLEGSGRDPSTRAIEERGDYTTVALWVGAWCTSGSSGAKGSLYGPTVFLRPPDPNT